MHFIISLCYRAIQLGSEDAANCPLYILCAYTYRFVFWGSYYLSSSINYLVLHCWGRMPSFIIFTSPFYLYQCTEEERLQLLVLFNFPILHWVMCGFCLCFFYTPNDPSGDCGVAPARAGYFSFPAAIPSGWCRDACPRAPQMPGMCCCTDGTGLSLALYSSPTQGRTGLMCGTLLHCLSYMPHLFLPW